MHYSTLEVVSVSLPVRRRLTPMLVDLVQEEVRGPVVLLGEGQRLRQKCVGLCPVPLYVRLHCGAPQVSELLRDVSPHLHQLRVCLPHLAVVPGQLVHRCYSAHLHSWALLLLRAHRDSAALLAELEVGLAQDTHEGKGEVEGFSAGYGGSLVHACPEGGGALLANRGSRVDDGGSTLCACLGTLVYITLPVADPVAILGADPVPVPLVVAHTLLLSLPRNTALPRTARM
mmetsp:Transcript_35560/g.76714  ORF Transcript_35560/g.76714 Transcript_35560/m.76714 type:complete len:230 (+) Transcript_35560:150-839(+)